MMAASLIGIGFVVLANNWVFIESQLIQVEPYGTIFAAVGERMNISCYSDLGSYDRLEWHDKYGNRFTENETLRIYTLSYSTRRHDYLILSFDPVSSVDSSTYLCYGKSNSSSNYTKVIVNVTDGYLPRFDKEFEYYEFLEGDDIYLECQADGYPEPEYRWLDERGREMRNNIGNWEVRTNGRLNIHSVNTSQDGTYTCIASNTYGNASKMYILSVSSGRSPYFPQKVERHELNVGTYISLYCYAEGHPTPEYNWIDTYGRNMIYTVGNWNASSKGVLEIYSIQEDQEGNYTCVASNAYGNDNKTYEIRILPRHFPYFPHKLERHQFVVGDNVTLYCYAEGNPSPEYKWLDKYGRNMNSTVGNWNASSKGVLEIYSIQQDQEGKYTCIASNVHGIDDKMYEIKISSGYSPYFRQKVERHEFKAGDDVTLYCYAEGSPTPQYNWIDKYGRNMNSTVGNWSASSNGLLEIYSIQQDQEGNYTCIASNAYGNDDKTYEIRISSRRYPYFHQKLERHEFKAGDDVTLYCYAEGNPSPEYNWFDKYGRNMNYTVGNWSAYSNGLLKIYSIQEDQEGNYTCVASNAYGNDSKTYEIRISSRRSPYFHQKVELHEFNAGDNVTLYCLAEGNPSPEYYWFDKYGRDMNNTADNSSASSKGELKIYSIQHNQEGNYTCVASNAYGNDSKTYEIRVPYYVDLKVNVTVREKWQTLVRFTISFKNESIKYQYVIAGFLARGSNGYWQKVLWNYNERQFLITGLEAGTTYDFKFGVKEDRYEYDLWIKNATMTLTFAPYSPLLIVRSVKEDSIEIEFPYQSTNELSGPLRPLYYMLRYVKLRQMSGSFYEEDCPIDIKLPTCNGRRYVIGGLYSNYYYKIQLHYLLQTGSSDKSEIIVHTVGT